MGEYGDFMGTLQQISALVVGEMWGLRFLNALLSGNMWGLHFCSTERRLGTSKESVGQDDIEHLAKMCFLSHEYMSKKKTSATEKAKKDNKKARRQELSSRWSGGKCLLHLQKGGRSRLHDTVQ